MKHFIFPSVVEQHDSELRNVAADLLHGLRIYHDDTGYLVGSLALSEGASPHKAINCAPQDLDYQVLLKSGLLLADMAVEEPITLTVGFPFSTFQVNRGEVPKVAEGKQEITYDTMPYGGQSRQTRKVKVNQVDVIPEIVGCIIGARKGPMKQKDSFFMVSLGYGTFEACLSTEAGIVQRTMVSNSGLRFAIDVAMREVMETHYMGLRNEHQFDAAFQRGSIIVDRKRVDLTDVRKRALEHYYENVISPLLRNRWTDADFERSSELLLAGGASLYTDLVACFEKEFKGLLNVRVVDDPITLVSTGYCLRSKSLTSENSGVGVGLDIGNAQTVVTVSDGKAEGGES